MAKIIRSIGPGRAQLEALLAQKDATARVGFLDPDAAYKAAIHENGVAEKNIPPRPFMRPAAEANREKWKELAASAVPTLLEGRATLKTVLGVLAADAQVEVRKSIDAVQSPVLKKKTVDRKAAKKEKGMPVPYPSKPLYEEGHMRNSVLFDVEDAE